MPALDGAYGASLNALRSFEAAARHLSFAAAAEELGVTASAISVQIRRLEARVGRPLFVRGHRSVALSETGARLAPKLAAAFAMVDRALSDEVGPANDTVEISAMPSFASKWLASRLPDFDARPGPFRTRLVGQDRLVDFDRDPVDVGLRYGRGDYPSSLYVERLTEVRAFPVCSPAFRDAHAEAFRSPQGLLDLPLLADETSRRADGLPNWPAWFAAANIHPGRIKGPIFESLHLALSAAAAGRGVALGLAPLVDDDLHAGALVRPFEVELPSPYAFWFVCRADRQRERKIRAFRAWIFEAMACRD